MLKAMLVAVGLLIILGLIAAFSSSSIEGSVGLGAGIRNGLVISGTIGATPTSAAQKAAEDANGGGVALGGAVSGNMAGGKETENPARLCEWKVKPDGFVAGTNRPRYVIVGSDC